MKTKLMKKSIRQNLSLANNFMEKGDFSLAIYRLQDARHLLEELESALKTEKNKSL